MQLQGKNNALSVTYGAVIAALYVVLTYLANLVGLASGVIQVRISESLTILPVFTVAAVPGLTIGCLLANLLTGCLPWDIVFGTLATLLGAIGTRVFRKNRLIAILCPIVSNTIIVPLILRYAYGVPDSFPYIAFTVFVGEVISCGLLGLMLGIAMDKSKLFVKR